MKCLRRDAGFLMFYTLKGFSAALNVEEDVLAKFRFFFLFISGRNLLSFLFCSHIKFHLSISLRGKTHVLPRTALAVLPPCRVRGSPRVWHKRVTLPQGRVSSHWLVPNITPFPPSSDTQCLINEET